MSRKLFMPEGLQGVVRAGDRRQFRIAEKNLKDAVDAASMSMLAGNVVLTNFHTTNVRGRTCVSYKAYDVHLLLRSVTKHFRRRFRVPTPARDNVVRGLIEALLDASPGSIVRRDIRSFYETLPTFELRQKLANDTVSPPLIRDYIGTFFDTHCPHNLGIPRGTPISPLLADIAMQDFDDAIRKTAGVFRYYRFADDIIALTTGRAEDLSAQMEAKLPAPMSFNEDKTHNVKLEEKARGVQQPAPVEFEYLGYKFAVSQTREKKDSRVVHVAISGRKIQRLKSRISLAVKNHSAAPDWPLLIDRMQYLTANFRLLRGRVTSIKDSPYIRSGLYYNYNACGTYYVENGEHKSEAYDRRELKELDGFYHSAIRRLTTNIVGIGGQIAALRRLSFNKSYELKIHRHFDPARIAEIKSCWRNM